MPTEKSSSAKRPANKRQYSSNKALSSKHYPSLQDKPATIGDYARSGYQTLTATENGEVLKATVGFAAAVAFFSSGWSEVVLPA